MQVSDAISAHKRILRNEPIQITKLRQLKINNYGWGTKQKESELLVDAIRKSPSLTALEFHLDESALIYLLREALSNHPTIRSVTITGDYISNAMEQLQQMIRESCWTELTVNIEQKSHYQVDALSNICSAVERNKTITTLDLSKCQIGETIVNILARLFAVNDTITSLFIEVDSDVDLPRLANVLEKKKQLVAFGILGAIDKESNWTALSRALRANKSLTHLELYPEVSEGGARELAEILRENRLKSLSADLYEEDMDTIYEELLSNTSLTSLDFGGSIYTNTDLLSEVIKVNTSLQRLSVAIASDKNKEELMQLSDAFRHNTTLTDLHFGSDQNRSIWKEFQGAFQHNTTLRHLTVSNGNLHESDWKYIAEVLRSSTTLKSFTCTKNLPGTPEFEVLCQGLKKNKSLTNVTLRVDDDLKEELDVLFNALKENTTLRSLTIDSRTVYLPKYQPNSLLSELNLETLDITSFCRDENFIQEVGQLSFARKVALRKDVTNLVVSLFNISRRPESFDVFPREIWQLIFNKIITSHLDVGEAAEAIFEDNTLRRIVQFDKYALDATSYCHFS
jgi:hypothetical protein